MSHTFYKQLYHLVWSTYERNEFICNDFKPKLFQFLGGAFRAAGCIPIEIGGMSDHIHALVGINPKYSVSEIIRDVKVCSSKWCKDNLPNERNFSWQEGFGSFTVSASQEKKVRTYILNQEKHHLEKTFKSEFIELLNAHEIEFEEKFLWR